MNCKKHAMCFCPLKKESYSQGFQSALKKAAKYIRESYDDPDYIVNSPDEFTECLMKGILKIREDHLD